MAEVSGKAIVLPIAVLLMAAIAVLAIHEWQQLGEPPQAMTFTRLPPPNGTAPPRDVAVAGAAASGNATPFLLTFDAVHKQHEDSFLEDHLDTAVERGASTEREVLRIDRMQATLAAITGHAGPEWTVEWRGVTVRIEHTVDA